MHDRPLRGHTTRPSKAPQLSRGDSSGVGLHTPLAPVPAQQVNTAPPAPPTAPTLVDRVPVEPQLACPLVLLTHCTRPAGGDRNRGHQRVPTR